MKLQGVLTINNWDCSDPVKYPYISVRVVDGELWYYGADSTYEHALRTIQGMSNAFIVFYNDII